MRKYPTSTADFSEGAKLMVKGGEANKAEIARWGLAAVKLQKLLEIYQAANSAQERAKAAAQQATLNWQESKKKLKTEMARWVSTLEANYGKTGDKLQEFGIAPRKFNPKKGPRTKKA